MSSRERTARRRSGGEPERNGAESARVRPAGREDLERIVAIERASFSDPWRPSSFASLIGDPRVLFLVAELPELPVAGYLVTWFAADEGEIANLAVAADARRRGVARALLGGVLEEARSREASALYLEVRESNEAARRLYESHGFSAVGRRRNYYRLPLEDALVLRLVLPVRRISRRGLSPSRDG